MQSSILYAIFTILLVTLMKIYTITLIAPPAPAVTPDRF